MNTEKIHSRMAKVSSDASTAAKLPSPTRSPLPDSAYLKAPDRDELVFNMPASVDDAQMDDVKAFCDAMLTKHGISIDEALYELYRQQWDIRAAEQHLSAVVKEDREWSEADKRLFHVGFTTFGKEFDKIRPLLPHKPLGAVVKHYYDTKKLQFYRTFTPEESGEVDDVMSLASGVNSCSEGANEREDACAGCLTVADCQVVPRKSPVSNLSDDMENMEMQADNDVQPMASPAKRSSSAGEARSGPKKPKKAIVCTGREVHAPEKTFAMEPIKEVRRFMRMNQENVGEVISKERSENVSDKDESLVLDDDVEIICLDGA